MDRTNIGIIRHLRDGRKSYKEIADDLSITENTVRSRVQQMAQEGVLSITGLINAEKVRVTGNKAKQKLYYRHSGYPGGLKSTSFEKMLQAKPVRVIEYAVKGMLPPNRLGAKMIRKLRVYAGDAHPHLTQTKTSPTKVADKGIKA